MSRQSRTTAAPGVPPPWALEGLSLSSDFAPLAEVASRLDRDGALVGGWVPSGHDCSGKLAFPVQADGSGWGGGKRAPVTLDHLLPDQWRELVKILARHTTRAAACEFAVEPGRGDLGLRGVPGEPPFFPIESQARQYLLYSGPLANWPHEEPWSWSPNICWPDDLAWTFVWDIDFPFAYVGATAECLGEIDSNELLDLAPVERGDEVGGRPRSTVYAPDLFAREILPRLAGVKLSEIVEATGMSKAFASQVRGGKFTPHVSTWESLAGLSS